VTSPIAPALEKALIHHRHGRLDEAARCYEGILLADPGDFDARYYLAQMRAAQKRYDDAYALMCEAAALRPDSIEAHYHVGALLLALGRPNQAMAQLNATRKRAPAHVATLIGLGAALHALERLREAEACYRNAVALAPESPEALRGLAGILAAADRPKDALDPLHRLLELDPHDARTHSTLGGVLRRLERYDEALAHCRTALQLDPDFAEAHANLGNVELELGDIAQAKERFERAIELAPENVNHYGRLAVVTRFTLGDPRLETMERLARDPSLSKNERIGAYFALGKALDTAGEPERAFDYLARGNALKRSVVDYDAGEELSSLARTSAFVGPEFMRERSGWGDPSDLPVFIVGMPRSGTTLIEQILASHPSVYAAGELPHFQDIARVALAGDSERAIDVAAMASATREQIRDIGARYVTAVARMAPQAVRVTDKMPANATYVGLMHLALPRARIIRARRDPVDTCLSCFQILFAEGQSFTYDLGELGRYYRAYEALLDHWERVLPPGTILDVRYEDVVADIEAAARRIVDFCCLDWNDACLRFHETQRPVQTASVVQVRKPIYRGSVGKWRRYAHRLKPLLDALGVEE
jgi:tetratricopeptide (TPR) repeat protein